MSCRRKLIAFLKMVAPQSITPSRRALAPLRRLLPIELGSCLKSSSQLLFLDYDCRITAFFRVEHNQGINKQTKREKPRVQLRT